MPPADANSKLELLQELAVLAKVLASELGFSACAISAPEVGQQPEYLARWLEQGYQGTMQWLENNLDKRRDPKALVPGTSAILSLRLDYLPPNTQALKVLNNPNKAYISRYALGRDYHKLIRKRLSLLGKKLEEALEQPKFASLKPLQYRAFTDSAPVMEKALASQAGLGWQAKNCLLITPKAGSWFFLGELFINLPLPPDQPLAKNHCGTCTACHQACPTQAFVGDGQLDARRCISYLTIEYKGSIDPELRPLMGNRIYGCDDCQLVCPWNRFAPYTQEADFHPRQGLENADLLELFAWTEQEFLYKTAGSPIRRIGYEQWQRNLAIALGNAPASPAIQQALQEKLALTKSELVAEHLNWALKQQTGA